MCRSLYYNDWMSFQLITPRHDQLIAAILEAIPTAKTAKIASDLEGLIGIIREDIPEKRRISTGRYSIIKALGERIQPQLKEGHGIASQLFAAPITPFVRSLALQILSLEALDNSDLALAIPTFETASGDEDWIVRECASGLVRKLIKAFPEKTRDWYLKLVLSPDPNQRRFVSESLRPVVENRWFHNDPEYPLGIIKSLFKEAIPYPRTSVGNNISDWMRVKETFAWPIVNELAHNGDENSFWIAYRACRNIVKVKQVEVMQLLNVEEYTYKKRHYRLVDYR